MAAHFNLALSDNLNQSLDQIAATKHTNKGEIIRRALEIYLASVQASEKGFKLGFFDPLTEEVKTEIVGL